MSATPRLSKADLLRNFFLLFLPLLPGQVHFAMFCAQQVAIGWLTAGAALAGLNLFGLPVQCAGGIPLNFLRHGVGRYRIGIDSSSGIERLVSSRR